MRAKALLLSAAIAIAAAPCAHAQIGGRGRLETQAPGFLAQRLVGEWRGENVRMVFISARDGALYANAFVPKAVGERHLQAVVSPTADGGAMIGGWRDIGGYADRWTSTGEWSLTIKNSQLVVTGQLHGRSGTTSLRPVPHSDSLDPVEPIYQDWLGDWAVHGGTLRLALENGRMVGTLRMPAPSGLKEIRRELLFSGKRETFETTKDTMVGLWQAVGDYGGGFGEARMTLLPGKRAFGGTLAGDTQYGAWRGTRAGVEGSETLPAPTPVPQPPPPAQPTTPRPVPQTPTPTTPLPPAPSTPTPTADGFEALAKWDVRVDRVENPRDDRLVHVYPTLRNAGSQNLLQTEDVWVYLETSDGLTQRSGQGLRALPGPAQLFGSPPPVVLPGKEIKTKFIFDRQAGVTIKGITVMEGDRRAEFAF
jgi:hypothetical protein